MVQFRLHAGEENGYKSKSNLEFVLDSNISKNIGHGIRLKDLDDSYYEKAKNHNFELTPYNYIYTGLYNFEELYERIDFMKQYNISISPDDPNKMQDAGMSENFKLLRQLGFTLDEVNKMRKFEIDRLDKFKNNYMFYNAYKQNKVNTDIFIKYMISRFNLSGSFNRKKFNNIQNKITNMIKKRMSDKDIYKYLIHLKPDEESEEKNYKKTTDTKVNKLEYFVGKVDSILDMGTEDIKFLDSLQKIANKVRGINIGEGFCHYHFCDKQGDDRFQLYDGKNIPYPDESFDLLTLYSVIHHIEDDDFYTLLKDIYRVTKKYVFIKDVNLDKDFKRDLYDIQHILYEDVLYTQGESYRNETVTFNKTKKAFERNGFKLIKSEFLYNFNGTYYALFEKV